MADYYTILGVERTASTAEIEAAYRQLAIELDPAALPETVSMRVRELAEAEFLALQQAQRILTNPVTRTAYTHQLAEIKTSDLAPADMPDVELGSVPAASVLSPSAAPVNEALTPSAELNMQAEDLPGSDVPSNALNTVPSRGSSTPDRGSTDARPSRQDLWDLDEAPLTSMSPWLMRLGVAIVLTAGVLLSFQGLRPSRTNLARQQSESLQPEPLRSELSQPEPSQPDSQPESAVARTGEAPAPTGRAQLPTTGEITRFAAAAIAMRPLVSETDAALAAAAAAEQTAILLDFEIAAAAIVREHSLSLEEYHAIAQQVRETPALQLQVAQLAGRLINTD